MAFTESEIISISQILRVGTDDVNAQLTYLGELMTPAKETAVRSEITRWNGGAKDVYATFTPTESNKGFNLNANAAKADIRSNIAVIFERTDWGSSIGRLYRT